jgi:hypothetical protein
VIVGGAIVGALAYLVIGRQAYINDAELDSGRDTPRTANDDALDRLYGPRSGGDSR